MQQLITQFLNYLKVERGLSPRTILAYRHDLSKFSDFILSIPKSSVSMVTKEDIRAFLTKLADQGFKKPNIEITRARKVSAIKSFFNFLVKEGFIPVNPAIDIKAPKIPEKEPCYLTQDEYQELLATVKAIATPYYRPRDLAIITLLLGTGIRLSELVGLTTQSIKLNNGESTVKVKGKGNKERTIPLNVEVASVLDKYLKTRPDLATDNLFISRKSNGLSSGAVYHLVKHYLEKAGIKKEKLGVHSLRHTFATSLLNNKENVNLVHIQKLLGHSKLETTRRYLHVSDIDLRNAVNSLVLNKQ